MGEEFAAVIWSRPTVKYFVDTPIDLIIFA